jgi:hypothetical protein
MELRAIWIYEKVEETMNIYARSITIIDLAADKLSYIISTQETASYFWYNKFRALVNVPIAKNVEVKFR